MRSPSCSSIVKQLLKGKNVPKRKTRSSLKNKRNGATSSAPVARARTIRIRDPQVKSSGVRSHIKHTEFVTDVHGSAGFIATPFSINPGLSNLFKWLSGLTMQYERYKFSNLNIRYEPRCSSSTPGSVMMAIDYDPLDDPPSTKQALLSYQGNSVSSAWQSCNSRVNPMILRERGFLYNRSGAAAGDLKTYDLGNLFLCTSGQIDDTVIGELYVDYDVELSIPQWQQHMPDVDHLFMAYGNPTPNALLTNAKVQPNSNIDVSLTAGILTFNQSFRGVIVVRFAGSSIEGDVILAGTCTAATLVVAGYKHEVSSTGNVLMVAEVSAVPGQTLSLSMSIIGVNKFSLLAYPRPL